MKVLTSRSQTLGRRALAFITLLLVGEWITLRYLKQVGCYKDAPYICFIFCTVWTDHCNCSIHIFLQEFHAICRRAATQNKMEFTKCFITQRSHCLTCRNNPHARAEPPSVPSVTPQPFGRGDLDRQPPSRPRSWHTCQRKAFWLRVRGVFVLVCSLETHMVNPPPDGMPMSGLTGRRNPPASWQ